ncbi:MAG: hypothetical protein IAE84_11975, partial [Saprospiraceae bacterium]|nr:hypothetical protein [Saprospiraceae bacterium]
MTHTILSTITVIFGLTACMHSNHPETAENPIAASGMISPVTSTQSDSIIYDDFIFPVDSIFTAKVLTVGTFHKDEVSKNASRFKWYGLFKSQNGYYLKQTKKAPGEFEVWNDIYNSNVNCDIAIYGSSRAWVHIDPKILSHILQLNVYNFGIDGHNFWLQYLRHIEFLKYNPKPKN